MSFVFPVEPGDFDSDLARNWVSCSPKEATRLSAGHKTIHLNGLVKMGRAEPSHVFRILPSTPMAEVTDERLKDSFAGTLPQRYPSKARTGRTGTAKLDEFGVD